MTRPENGQRTIGAGYLTLAGQLPDGRQGKGLRYAIVVRPVLPQGGKLIARDNELLIVDAPVINLYIAHNTNYYNKRSPLIAA